MAAVAQRKRDSTMTTWLAIACLLEAPPALGADEVFVQETAILAITMDDQTHALKTRAIEKEVTITEAVRVLTTYRVVTRDQYLNYDHTDRIASGAVNIKGRGTFLWAIEPGYAAVVTPPVGGKMYLMRPELEVPATKGK
jgi:hypothetical protein